MDRSAQTTSNPEVAENSVPILVHTGRCATEDLCVNAPVQPAGNSARSTRRNGNEKPTEDHTHQNASVPMLPGHTDGPLTAPKLPPNIGDAKTIAKSRTRSAPTMFAAAALRKPGRPAAATRCVGIVGRSSIRCTRAKQASETGANPGHRSHAEHNPVKADGELVDRICPWTWVLIHDHH
jgi:hypothetical protein